MSHVSPGVAPHKVSRGDGESVSYFVARVLREAIIDGSLPPGARIGQDAVAKQFRLSRIPVRDALKQLEGEGLVRLIPNSGARVASLDLDELKGIYLILERL